MKLYYSPGACSLSPHIVAREAGLPLDLVRVDTKTHRTADGDDFHAVNPKGYVPALVLEDGSVLTEGPTIVQFLADQAPATGLVPAGGLERYRVLEWLGFINSELHKTFSPLFNPATPEETRSQSIEKLHKRFAWIDSQLSGRDYLMGDRFTVADAYLFTITNWARFAKVDISSYGNIGAFMTRVGARPQVQQALIAEGLVKAAA